MDLNNEQKEEEHSQPKELKTKRKRSNREGKRKDRKSKSKSKSKKRNFDDANQGNNVTSTSTDTETSSKPHQAEPLNATLQPDTISFHPSITTTKSKQKKKKKQKKARPPLHGTIVAISTLEEREQAHTNSELSYKVVSTTVQELGATVTTQVHKRVDYLVCTRSAVSHATQRVRKAIKRNVPLVDVAWVYKCQLEGVMVDTSTFRLEEDAVAAIEKHAAKRTDNEGAKANNDDEKSSPLDPNLGWTEAKSLGCCCVCHENGSTESCQWCSDDCE